MVTFKSDVADWIRTLRRQLGLTQGQLADPKIVREYVQDLKALLEESSLVEQKAFLKSFVERIEVDNSEVRVIYTVSMPPDKPSAEVVGVLPFIDNGPPWWMQRYKVVLPKRRVLEM